MATNHFHGANPRESVNRGRRLLLAVLLCIATAGGCATLTDLMNLSNRIEQAGYSEVEVNHQESTAGAVLTIDAVTPTKLPAEEDAVRIARIVWETYPRRFDELRIVLNRWPVVAASRADLAEAFGQRDPALDKDSGLRSVLLIALSAFAAIVVLLVAIVVLVIRRSRRTRHLPIPPLPPFQQYPQHPPNQYGPYYGAVPPAVPAPASYEGPNPGVHPVSDGSRSS